MTAIRDLFQLPETVTMTAFVHQIDGGEDEARKRQTLELYQVTPSIERKLDAAMAKLRDGLRDRKSIFTWIHGSFGSGKSHFMNVLSLLLADDPLVYEIHPELQKQRQEFHPEVVGRNLFRLHVQCISRGARTLEEIVFGPAIEELTRLFPEVPPPPLFNTSRIFASANELLQSLGDEKFFAAFPANQAEDDEWGDLASRWDRARFEAAVVDPSSTEGRALASELAQTPWLKDVVHLSGYVRLGEGLRILTDHLARLGYDGVVLFLDELILWLTTLQEDKGSLSTETAKVATLIEHGIDPLRLPLFTFAARQRDLSQMVGNFAVGRDEEIYRDNLQFWKDRFDEISLEDKDLARIIEARVLKPRSEEARAEIDRAFEGYRQRYQKDFNQLFGDQGGPEDFRRVYPFSPALVETMVRLSSTLQRDRTALRELTNLLVNYLPDFELGKVVPVGDLFDVVVHGKVSDLGTIQQVYEQARRVYEDELLPHIRKRNRTDNADRCQLLRESFEQRLGCSGCKENACRTQTRIAKTVLLQGIAPNASALRQLTASKIVALNSGTLKSVVPNREASLAAGYLREWAAISSSIQVEGDENPTVKAALDSIDTRRILDHNRGLDNVQRRRTYIRRLLFKELRVDTDKSGSSWLTFDWCGRNWRIGVVYENVRTATDPTFRPGEGEDLRLIIDFPFDSVGHSPADDEERLRSVLERGPQNTLVWLPAFLNEDIQNTLGDLVVLEGLLELRDEDFAGRVPWVSADDLVKARTVLRTQLGLKEAQVTNALMSAYGISDRYAEYLDPGRRPERFAHLLVPDAQLTLPPEGELGRCLDGLIRQALERLAPRHPPFTEQPTRARLEKVLETLTSVVHSEGQKRRVDPIALKDIRGIAAVEHLGLVRVVEDEVIFAGGLLTEVGRRLATRPVGALSVADVRAELDPDGLMWLSEDLQDFLVIAYATCHQPPYRFTVHGNPVKPAIGKLAGEAALVPVELPSVQEWERAVANAGVVGVTLPGRTLSATQMEDLSARVHERSREVLDAGLDELRQELVRWGELLGVDEPERTQRGSAVGTLLAFFRRLPGLSALETVRVLAAAPFTRERVTALAYMASADRVRAQLRLLRRESHQALVGSGRQREMEGDENAIRVMNELRRCFGADENVEPFATAVDVGTTALIRLIAQKAQSAPSPVTATGLATGLATGSASSMAEDGASPSRSDVPTGGEAVVIEPLSTGSIEVTKETGANVSPVIAGPRRVTLATPASLKALQEELSKHLEEGAEIEVEFRIRRPEDRS